jgi:hypothetical protein
MRYIVPPGRKRDCSHGQLLVWGMAVHPVVPKQLQPNSVQLGSSALSRWALRVLDSLASKMRALLQWTDVA